MNIAPVRWKDCTHRQNSCSKAFSSFYTLALHSFCGLASPCCRAMSVKTVHGHEFLIFLHFRLGLTLIMRRRHVFVYLTPTFDRASCPGLSCIFWAYVTRNFSCNTLTHKAVYMLVGPSPNGFWPEVLFKSCKLSGRATGLLCSLGLSVCLCYVSWATFVHLL